MSDAKSNYLERKNLDHNLGTTTFTKPAAVYAALHNADPGEDCTNGEISGGSYIRKVVSFSAAATDAGGITSATNSTEVDYSNLPGANLQWVSLWDAATGGNPLYKGPLSTPKTVTDGDGFTLNIGSITAREN